MKSKTFVLFFALLLLAHFASSQDALRKRFTNQDVISLVEMGLSDDVVTAKIRATNAADPSQISFDTTVDGLKTLKAAKVSDPVIAVMINPGATTTIVAGATPVTVDPNLPPPEVGVYWKDATRFVLIDGQVLSSAKIGGRAGSMFTYGFRGLHWDGYINGPTSIHVVKERRPVFYIYVADGSSSSDYSLIKLNKKSDRREFQIGSLSGKMGGGKAGVKRDKEMPFQAEHVGIRIYKLTLEEDLKPGEYAFFMATGQQMESTGRTGTGGAVTGRIYDFSLHE